MGELVSIESLAGKHDPCSKFIRQFLNDIYMGKCTPRKTAARELEEEANRYVHLDTAQPPKFCILKGFKPYISVVIFVDDELYSRFIPKGTDAEFERYAIKAQLWKDMSSPNFEGELVSHLNRKSAEMDNLKQQIAYLREKVTKLEQKRQEWLDWSNEPRAALGGKSIKEFARAGGLKETQKKAAQRASESGINKKHKKQNM